MNPAQRDAIRDVHLRQMKAEGCRPVPLTAREALAETERACRACKKAGSLRLLAFATPTESRRTFTLCDCGSVDEVDL